MQVICLEENAFYALLDSVLEHIRINEEKVEARWISGEEAMKRLGLKSKTSLQSYRDNGFIRFSKSPGGRVIVYDALSITEFLNKQSKSIF